MLKDTDCQGRGMHMLKWFLTVMEEASPEVLLTVSAEMA
jgi:hypothetical protein